MGLSGNKGEWSEIYVLLKLLAEGALPVSDITLAAIQSKLLPIVRIIRQETEDEPITFDFTGSHNRQVRVTFVSTNETICIPTSRFRSEADYLLSSIKQLESSGEIPQTERFICELGCKRLKSPSTRKSDINIVIHDTKAFGDIQLGFSIKSQVGGQASLVNSSQSTNFLYSVTPCIDRKLREKVNGARLFKEKFKLLADNNARLKFTKVDSICFTNNLTLVDSLMPNILAGALTIHYSGTTSKTSEIATILQSEDPLQYNNPNLNVYAYKLKKFLVESALGMTPAKMWDGIYDAMGGTIIVKTNGDLIAYSLYDRNLFESLWG